MYRLSEENLKRLPAALRPADYPRNVTPKVVHLGVGAFHRAHQAWYFERLNQAQPKDPWLIQGAALRSGTAAAQLNPQDGLYCHTARSAQGSETMVIQSILGVINAFDESETLANAIASATTQLITLTITEKGYCLNDGNTDLDMNNPQVQADLASLEQPQTAIGFLVAGLQKRHALHGNPVTILSCDNLSHNGDLTQCAVLAMAHHHDRELARWIEDNVSFPNAMVDRIAPAVSAVDRDQFREVTGLEDQGLAVTEQFSQWVIEDNFKGQKPPLERAGVIWVDDVAPWELRKLRLLNAAHTGLACLGSWLDITYVHEAIADPHLAPLIQTLWRESGTTLPADPDFEFSAYLSSLAKRFANPHLNHALAQIATDSSQKLPQRILTPLAECLTKQQPVPALTTVVAAWMCIQTGRSRSGADIPFTDPLATTMVTALSQADDCHRTRAEVIIQHYPPLAGICQDSVWRDQLIASYESLQRGELDLTLSP